MYEFYMYVFYTYHVCMYVFYMLLLKCFSSMYLCIQLFTLLICSVTCMTGSRTLLGALVDMILEGRGSAAGSEPFNLFSVVVRVSGGFHFHWSKFNQNRCQLKKHKIKFMHRERTRIPLQTSTTPSSSNPILHIGGRRHPP